MSLGDKHCGKLRYVKMTKVQKVFEQVVPFFRVLYYQWVRSTGKMPVPLFQTFCRAVKNSGDTKDDFEIIHEAA